MPQSDQAPPSPTYGVASDYGDSDLESLGSHVPDGNVRKLIDHHNGLIADIAKSAADIGGRTGAFSVLEGNRGQSNNNNNNSNNDNNNNNNNIGTNISKRTMPTTPTKTATTTTTIDNNKPNIKLGRPIATTVNTAMA